MLGQTAPDVDTVNKLVAPGGIAQYASDNGLEVWQAAALGAVVAIKLGMQPQAIAILRQASAEDLKRIKSEALAGIAASDKLVAMIASIQGESAKPSNSIVPYVIGAGLVAGLIIYLRRK